MSYENPYSAPQAPIRPEKFSKTEIWQVLGTGLVLGSALGAATNAINGWIGPSYFSYLLKWKDDIWRKAIVQGVMEGGMYGLLNAVIFVLIANYFGRGVCSVPVVRKYLLSCAAAVLIAGILGGVLGLLFAPAIGRHPLYRGPFPVQAFDETGFCWTVGSLNVAVGTCWLITLIAGYIYSRKRRSIPIAEERF